MNREVEVAKLVVAVVHDNDAQTLMKALNKSHFQTTRLSSTGGFLREGNTTFLIGTREKYLEELLEIIKSNCESRTRTVTSMSPIASSLESYYSFPMEVEIGGATVFVLEVERFHKL